MAPQHTVASAAAVEVLSQRVLLSLIASFQRGPPGVMAPLLRQLVDDGLVWCRVRQHWFGWAPSKEMHYISTPLHSDVRPKSAWAERVTPEALARYDTADLHALRIVLAASAVSWKPARATRRLLHRTTEDAAACGRVDMLEWLHDQHNVFTDQPLLVSFCVKLATRHGQIAVLEWLEATFSGAACEPLRSYVVHDVVKYGDLGTIHWLADRKLGVVPARSLRCAVERGDVAVLRLLLDAFDSTDASVHVPRSEGLVTFAMRSGQANVVEYLVGERKFGFTTTTLEKAIALRYLGIVKCFLDHRANLRANERSLLISSSLVQQLVGDNDLAMLETLASVNDPESLGCSVMTCCHFAKPSLEALRTLLLLSSAQDTAVTLMRFAVRKQTQVVQTILTSTDKVLPPDVVGFVDRVMKDALGPLAMRAMVFFEKRDNTVMDEILALLPKASHEDVRDTVLRFLPGPAFSLTSVLKADAKRAFTKRTNAVACNEPFLQLCLSLRQSESDPHHKGVQQYLHTRKKPRPPQTTE